MIENIDPFVIERLAEAAHEVWMEAKLRDGWRYEAVTNKSLKEHHCLVPYADLAEGDKQSDRDLVAGIPQILATAGYKIVPIAEEP